jgi:hypothetical protein
MPVFVIAISPPRKPKGKIRLVKFLVYLSRGTAFVASLASRKQAGLSTNNYATAPTPTLLIGVLAVYLASAPSMAKAILAPSSNAILISYAMVLPPTIWQSAAKLK